MPFTHTHTACAEAGASVVRIRHAHQACARRTRLHTAKPAATPSGDPPWRPALKGQLPCESPEKRAQFNATALQTAIQPALLPDLSNVASCVLSHGDARKRRPRTRFSKSACYGAPR